MAARCIQPVAWDDNTTVTRFAQFLAAAGPRSDFASLSPARRYHVRLLAWRVNRA